MPNLCSRLPLFTTLGVLSFFFANPESINAQNAEVVKRIVRQNWGIAGDWNGDHKSGVGVVCQDGMEFHLCNDLSGGPQQIPPFSHGGPDCVPIVGDWDGDGKDGIGVVYLNTMEFHLRNSLSQGPAEIPPFRHGGANCVPIAGDWDGDGKDGIGIV